MERSENMFKKLWLFSIITLGILMLAGEVNGASMEWFNQTVSQGIVYGGSPSLAIDSSGNPYISYVYKASLLGPDNIELKYAKWTGSTWNITIVDSVDPAGIIVHNSLALDASGNPHISYAIVPNFLGPGETELKFAELIGDKWNFRNVYSSDRLTGISMALDANGYPHISYQDGNRTKGGLKYAKWTGSTWNITTVDSTKGGVLTSIALDSSGKPHISYDNIDGEKYYLKYAKWTGNEWDKQNVESVAATGISMALDSSGYSNIIYAYVDFNEIKGGVKFAKWTGSKWNIQPVDLAGNISSPSIALDSSGQPYITFFDLDKGGLKYAKWTRNTWDIQIVDSTGFNGLVGTSNNFVLDSYDRPHISYLNQTDLSLKYASLNTRPDQPGNPSPNNGAANQPINLTLTWSGGDPDSRDTVTYKVYLDTNSNPITEKCPETTSTACQVSGLSYNTTYYWKVIASDGKASNQGSILSLTTRAETPQIGTLSVEVISEPVSIKPGQNSTIKVTVKDKRNGIPVSGASVSLNSTGDDRIINPLTGFTDPSGHFNSNFTGSAAGNFTVNISVMMPGYFKGEGDIQILIIEPASQNAKIFILVAAAVIILILLAVGLYCWKGKSGETNIEVNALPAKIPADGNSTAIITIKNKDETGNYISFHDAKTVVLTTTLGKIMTPVKIPPGSYSVKATITSSKIGGTATITAYIDSLNGECKVVFEELARRFCMICGSLMIDQKCPREDNQPAGGRFTMQCSKDPSHGDMPQNAKFCKICGYSTIRKISE